MVYNSKMNRPIKIILPIIVTFKEININKELIIITKTKKININKNINDKLISKINQIVD
jgi:hypothetical protein